MIYPELSRWIAQSESWQAFIDYNVPDEEKASYVFLERSGDFYISLLSKLQDALESFFENESEHNKADLLAIAKGLEIYSLKGKRENFYGINYKRNMLYVASLYYLCDYPATSFLLLKQFREEDFSTSVELFIYYFLSRNYNRKQAQLNPYFSSILDYLREGNVNRISDLDKLFSTILKSGSIESHLFVLTYIARGILRKFRSNNIWFDLFEFAPDIDWKPFVRYNIGKSPQVWSFFPSQQAAIRGGILTFDRAFSLQTPTSSGKTSISELIIFNELSRRPDAKILYLAPFRALASELKLNLGKNLSSKLGIKIKTIYGGNIVTDSERFGIAQSNVLISTPEKFMAIEMALKGVFDEFQVVICDEGHLIDSSSRGISYELLLSRLKRNEVIERRFVFLSAIVPNIEVINAWLGGSDKDIARSNYRPTEIELAFLVPVENRRFNLEVNPQSPLPKKYILNNFLSDSDFELGRKSYNPNSYKSKSVSSALKSLNSGAVAIFSPTKDSSQGAYGLAAEIIKQLGTKLPNPITYADAESVRDLTEFFSSIFGGTFILTLSAGHGFLFHHGDLPQFVREIVENAVRRERIKLLVCTSTLSEGVNLPIKTLVISNTRRYNADTNSLVSIPIRDLKNLIGRAGRAGKETRGTVIVVNPADREILLNVLANRNLEDVRGFLFHVTQVIEQVIVRAGTELSNEMLDTLRQSDHIDSAIIQLLAEDITVEGGCISILRGTPQ
jgi:helicase